MKLSNVIFFVGFLLFSSGISAQSYARQIKLAKGNKERVVQIEALLPIVEKLIATNYHDTLGLAYYALSYRYKVINDYQHLLECAGKGIDALSISDPSRYEVSRMVYYKGLAEQQLGRHTDAIHSYDQFYNIDISRYQAVDAYLRAKLNQAQIYRKYLGDNGAAYQVLNYVKTTPAYLKGEKQDKFAIDLEMSIAYGMERTAMGDSISWHYLEEAQQHIANESMKFEFLFKKAMLFWNDKKYEEARTIFYKIFKERISEGVLHNIDNATMAIINITDINNRLNEYEKTVALIEKTELLDNEEASVVNRFYLYNNLLTAYSMGGYTDKATTLSKKIDIWIPKIKSQLLPKDIARHQRDKAMLYYKKYKKYNKKSDLKIAESSIKKADLNIKKYEESLISKASSLAVKRNEIDYYLLGMDIAFESQNQDLFFYFSDRSRNSVLLKERTRPHIDMTQEFDLQDSINSGRGDLNVLKVKLAKLQKDRVIEQVTQNSNSEIGYVTLKVFKEKFPKLSMCNFSFGRDKLYLQVIDKSGKIISLGNRDSILLNLKTFKRMITDPNVDFVKGSLEELNISNYINKVNVLILPDGPLFDLPFEAISGNDEEKSISNIGMHYGMSANLYYHQEESSCKVSKMNIYCPKYKNDNNSQANGVDLPQLPFSEEESNNILSIIKKQGTDVEIVKSNFSKKYKGGEVFHFTGHGISSDDYNFNYLPIDNQGGRVYAYQIENFKTDSELVVFNACKTGTGKMVAGEGVMSLGRSITLSGAHSVVTALWPIDDNTSSTILASFYQNLVIGQNKSTALINAKKSFLSQCPDYQKHPYYWSGIILSGNDNPLEFCRDFSVYIKWIIVSIIILIIIYVIKKKYSTKGIVDYTM
ncbi:MAG: CHAT domain-containing protein [Saprospiraceae bacterium]